MITMHRVEVFKTTVSNKADAALLLNRLAQHYTAHTINFDLEDCDCVLRIEGADVNPLQAQTILQENGYLCEPLP